MWNLNKGSNNTVGETILAFHKALSIEWQDSRTQSYIRPSVVMEPGSGAMWSPPHRSIVSAVLLPVGQDQFRVASGGVPFFNRWFRRFLHWIYVSIKHLTRGKKQGWWRLYMYKDMNPWVVTCYSLSRNSRSARDYWTWPWQCQKVCSNITSTENNVDIKWYQVYGLNINSVPKLFWR